MKFRHLGWLLMLGALPLFADVSLDVNGSLKAAKPDSALPDGWIYYPQYSPKLEMTSKLLPKEGGNALELRINKDFLPMFWGKLIPAVPGEKFRIELDVAGDARVVLGAYLSDRKGQMGGTILAPEARLNGEAKIFAEFVIPEGLPNRKSDPPGYIRFLIRVYPGSLRIEKMTAQKLGEAAAKPAPRSATERINDDFSDLSQWNITGGAKLESIEADGRKAMKMPYPGKTASRIYPLVLEGAADADAMQGITFEVKGVKDRTVWLPVTVGSYGDWGFAYTRYIPVTGDQFRRVTIAWSDFVQPRGTRGMEFGKPGAMTPAGINQISFGDNWMSGNANVLHAAAALEIRSLGFAAKAEPAPAIVSKGFAPLADVVKKMRAKQPVLIGCSGDSLTANGEVGKRYAEVMEQLLRKKYDNPAIEVEIIAVGGAHSYNLRTWAERDFKNLGRAPDLLTLTVGYNDRSAAMDPEIFKASINDYLDRVSHLADGKSAVLLMPTMPARAERYLMQDSFADAFRAIAKERNLPLFDLHRVFKAMPLEKYESNFADKCHFNVAGHALIGEEITQFLDRQ